ncbi:MAG: excisionase family DNA-binding protein [Deltaproteobacteria bacterium]|nr:excisionase family DNA-binding protein [Deltaproteobacteria bacterium]
MDKIYTPEELAQLWKVSLLTIYKLLGQNKIPHFRVGRAYRIPEDFLQSYMEQEGNLSRFQQKKEKGIPKVAQYFIDLLQKESEEKQKNILEVRLFGSYARGEATKDSDVDLFILFRHLDSDSEHWLNHLDDLAMEAVDYNDLLSTLSMEKEHWERHERLKSPLFQAIQKDGILLWPKH